MIKCNFEKIISKENKPIAYISPGKTITIETINAYGKKFSNLSDLIDLINDKSGNNHHHPLTGPIYVNGLKKGDIVKIHIKKIELQEMAQALSKTAGVEPLDNPTFGDRSPIIGKLDKKEISYLSNISLSAVPMIGIIATTTEKIIKTGHTGKTGGNLDIPFLTEGSDIYLPVEIDGGGIYLGDVHAVQGYGELGGIAMEASAKVKLIISIHKPASNFNFKYSHPIIITGKEPLTKRSAIAVIGISDNINNLDSAVIDAYRKSSNIIQELLQTQSENLAKSLVTLIGHSINGQALSKTTESTTMILFLEKDLKKIFKTTENGIIEIINSVYPEK